ncbi:MAG: hypothetical protein HY912_10815 [Desulfomonile tiedjei]|uniref:Uncharacterized protein n=1 Tax=Desulfomonile tiedjei TaxID=2358 RepID=A0A9D6Z3J8_9BACT|nr:hypothetical protein [Desulfomonile tiedjei]
MARILYGVMGDARGHVTRAHTVAQQMPGHEFLFLGGRLVNDLNAYGYAVEDIPVPGTSYKNNQVDVLATVGNALRVFAKRSSVIRRIGEIIESFDPDLILTDYEYFTPLAARSKGRLCISLDHQHIITHCTYETPPVERLGRVMTRFAVQRLYSNANLFLIVSFFSLPPVNPETTHVLPAIVRNLVKDHVPADRDHVVVYLTSPTFFKLLPILEQMKARFMIYGFGDLESRKNLVFRPFSTHGFLQDLSSCRYAIVNGGHNVISEALYFGKPVFSFPIRQAYEQFMNAYFLAQSAYGDYSIDLPSKSTLEAFESGLDLFKDRIKQTFRVGNQDVASILERFMGNKASTG